jgi:hypothetical protein
MVLIIEQFQGGRAIIGRFGVLAQAVHNPYRRGVVAIKPVNDGPPEDVVTTYHPAAVLRAPDAVMREQMRQALIDDLRIAVGVIVSRTTGAFPNDPA